MSIDWLGDGTASSELQSSDSTLDPPYSLFVMVELADNQDGPRAQATIAQRMIDAGFAVVDDSGGKWVFDDAEWLVSVLLASDPTGGDDPFPLIWVQIVDDDERAAEILAPITDALGTLS